MVDNRISWIGAAVVAVACSRPAQLQAVPAASRTQLESIDWLTYNASLTGERFSPIRSLSPRAAPLLGRTCAYDTGKPAPGAQTGPLVIDGTLYFTDKDSTYAVDGVTCREKWTHVRTVQPPVTLGTNRGVAYLEGRLFRGYTDGHVVAFDAASGRQLWDVQIANPARGESITMAPIAWNGLVYIGNAGGDNFGVTGHVFALRATTGSTAWRFDTVPSTPEVLATWPEASAKNPPTGGALWSTFSLNPGTGVLYASTGNAAPDFILDLRTGQSLYSNAVIALDAHTGKLLAYVQPIPRDEHDHDVAAAPALITTRGGRRLALTAAKNGRAYGIERLTLRNVLELAVMYFADTTTRGNLEERLSTARPVRFCPGTQGGTEWNGPAYSPELNLAYVGAADWCSTIRILTAAQTLAQAQPGKPYTGGADPDALFGQQDPYAFARGWLTAFDADTGQVRWRYMAPEPVVAGVTVTAGGLLFMGDLSGMVRAMDARTGTILWQDRAGDAIGGGIVTYAVAGRPFLAVVTGQPSGIWPVPNPQTTKIVVYSPGGGR
ncbi:MAG TPA: PQQ-binding-like beta-propeller repeat protein [Kofleriaceae bacterium]